MVLRAHTQPLSYRNLLGETRSTAPRGVRVPRLSVDTFTSADAGYTRLYVIGVGPIISSRNQLLYNEWHTKVRGESGEQNFCQNVRT